jgi:hypothetical protein
LRGIWLGGLLDLLVLLVLGLLLLLVALLVLRGVVVPPVMVWAGDPHKGVPGSSAAAAVAAGGVR